MKVQLHAQSMRLRIDEDELARLLQGVAVGNRTDIGGVAWSVRVVAVDGTSRWECTDGVGTLRLDAALLAEYVARLPCRDGLQLQHAQDAASTLQIEFAVDVRDSIERRGPRRRGRRIDA